MGMFNFLKRDKAIDRVELVTRTTNNYFSFSGKLYDSDIVKSCVRVDALAIGKAVIQHVREYGGEISINPEPYMQFLLSNPNPWMTMQQMMEKVVTQWELNNNAFILISRDENGFPYELYPINANYVEAIFDKNGFLFYKFYFKNGHNYTFSAYDVIHLRTDVYEDDIFGTSPMKSLKSVMEVVNTTDQGIVNAIKNSSIIRWLLKYKTTLKPQDIKKNTRKFVNEYLKVSADNDYGGVVASDNKADIQQIEPKDFVPNAVQMKNSTLRIYAFYNTNEKIITSSYNDEEWNAYYEAQIEPKLIQIADVFTFKLFTRKQIAFGNKITAETSNIQYASVNTKLNFVSMVDRGAMTPNEWRKLFGLPPVEGGDKPIRRLDTQEVISEGGEDDGDSS